MAEGLLFDFNRWSDERWPWWEGELSYDNARLPEAMLRAGLALRETAYIECALEGAQETFEWFSGRNIKGLPMGDPRTGGCHDGLTREGVNVDMGAESTLSYVRSATSLALAHRLLTRRAAA